jgi:hypothetical protein
MYTLTIQANSGFNQPILLNCFGAPIGSTCTVSPSSVNPNGSSTTAVVKVTTTGSSGAALAPLSSFRQPPAWFAVPFAGSMLLALALLLKRRSRLAFLPAFALLILFLGCGGGNNNSITANSNGANSPTPAGSYALTLTGSSGNQVQATNFVVIVK